MGKPGLLPYCGKPPPKWLLVRLPSSLCRFSWTPRARFPQGIVRTDREEYRQILRASGTRGGRGRRVSRYSGEFSAAAGRECEKPNRQMLFRPDRCVWPRKCRKGLPTVGRHEDDPADSKLGPSGTIEWELTDCPLCGRQRWSTLLEAADVNAAGRGPRFSVVRCCRCGLCFTNPRPSPASIGQFYPAEYGPHRLRQAAAAPGGVLRWTSRLRAGLCRQSHGLDRWGQGRLLDFGCGSGSFLQRMQRRGWDVLGVDISAVVVQRIRRELGLPALAGSLWHPELPTAGFDLITMWQSLEHVHRPLEILRRACELTAPGGRLIVSVPNIESGPFRWFGSAWFALELPRHLTHFSAGSLRRMVELAGFRVDSLRMVRHSSWLQSSARLARRLGRNSPWLGWLRFRPICRLATWYCILTGQSDCIVLTATRPGHCGGVSDGAAAGPVSAP